MKKNITLFISVAACIMLVGCNKGNEAPSAQSITVTASIGSMTKVVYTGDKSAFEAGDDLSLFAWLGDKTVIPAAENLVVNNVVNTLDAETGLWKPESQMLWDSTVDPHYFMAVSPARKVTSFTADPYVLDSSAEKYQQSDLLVAINDTGLKAADNPVPLTFEHLMAKLNVNLSFRNQWTPQEDLPGNPNVEAKIDTLLATAKAAATIDYINKAVTVAGEAAPVGMSRLTNATWTTLMVPQEGFRTITIQLKGNDEWLGGNGTYEFTHSADIPLVSGKVTTVNLIVGRDQITLDEKGITIVDWAAEETIDGKIVDPIEKN